MYLSAFTTPEAIIRQLEKADTGSMPTEADSDYTEMFRQLKDYCLEVSDWFSQRVNQTFVPYYEEKELYIWELRSARRLFSDTLYLPEAMLELDTFTWISTAVTSTYYHLLSAKRTSLTPYRLMRIDPTGISSWNATFTDSLTLAAWWGVHTNYSQAYTNMETVTLATTAATSLTVTDASLYDTYEYLRIEDELVWITARNESTNVLTITRGANGTTAAAHTGKTAQRFNVQYAVKHALTRFVAWAYDNRSNFGTLQFSDGSAVVQSMPKYVQEAVELATYFELEPI